MKHSLNSLYLLMVTIALFTYTNVFSSEKRDTAVVVTDSLDYYRYHVSHMTILLDESPVHYTVIFDTVTNKQRPQYRQVDGTIWPYDAVKYYGEKYRKGILIYKKESEDINE
nr:hypothetical protein [uncultured Bacteroides sp.]